MTGQAEAPGSRANPANPGDPPARHDLRSDPRQWVDLHGDVMFRFALARLRDRDAAEEAVQETLLAGLKARASFAGDCSERTWLIGILKHKVVDQIRRRCRDRGGGEAPGNASTDDPGPDFIESSTFGADTAWGKPPRRWKGVTNDPAGELEREEFAAALKQCLAGVPERAAQAFLLKVVDEASAEEVCKALSISPTNLWVMLHRARLKLRACLEQRWFLAPERKGGRA